MKVQVDLSYFFLVGVLGGTVLQNNFSDSTRFFSPSFFHNCYIVVCVTWKFSRSLKGT